jgi:hypothetical protein
VTIERLIAALQDLVLSDQVPPGATVYVREKTALNGAGWVSPRTLEPGYDPHPLSAANDGTLVVFIS